MSVAVKHKTTGAERAARTRRLKKVAYRMACQARSSTFNEWFAIAARESPQGSSRFAIRWFDEAWRDRKSVV